MPDDIWPLIRRAGGHRHHAAAGLFGPGIAARASCPCNCRGAAFAGRTTEIVPAKSKGSQSTRPGSVPRGGVRRTVRARGPRASNAAACFRYSKEPEVRLKRGFGRRQGHGDLRRRLSALEGSFQLSSSSRHRSSLRESAPRRIFTCASQGPARQRGRKLWAAATDEMVEDRQQDAGATSVFSPSPPNTPQIC